jgi:glycine oxidase
MLDVAVLGGGIIGCAIARELARGGLRVAVFERRRVGSEASSAAAGMLGVQAETDDAVMLRLGAESRALYPAWLEALRDETGITVESWREGTLWLVFTAADEATLAARCEWQRAAGMSAERLTAREVFALEPRASRRARAGVLFGSDGRVDCAALTNALGTAVAAAGGAVREGTDVKAVIAERGRVTAVVTNAGRVACAAVVNAMGAWAGRVRGMTPLPVHPVRGQIAVVEAPRPPFRHALYTGRGYAVARRDGRVLLGSTRESVGYDKRVTAGGLATILAAATEIAPDLRGLPLIDAWAGLRPGSPDGRPIVGADPAVRGYYVATAHFRNGILLAPLTARVVGALVRGEPAPWRAELGIERIAGAASVTRVDCAGVPG